MDAKEKELVAKEIEEILCRELSPTEFRIENQSHLHAGHDGFDKGGHYFVELTSEKFNAKSPLERQRMVFALLDELMDTKIHALSMKCSPSK